jgi:Ca-activated chloride channel family protein
MSRVRVVGVVLCAFTLAMVVASGSAVSSQATGAVISGTVQDAAGGVLPGVTVTLIEVGPPVKVIATRTSDKSGLYTFANVPPGVYQVQAELSGFKKFISNVRVRSAADKLTLPVKLELGALTETLTVTAAAPVVQSKQSATGAGANRSPTYTNADSFQQIPAQREPWRLPDTASYARIESNRFQRTLDQPLSTFGADVDTASFTNVRRFLTNGRLPPRDAVRVEELLNYFRFQYAEPRGERPIGISTEVGECPWAPEHKLVLIGARARTGAGRESVGRNIVLLLDVSGSMAPPERLPLIKTAFSLWVDTLRADDRVAIVTYAGTSGVALPSTRARNRETIHQAIDRLDAGGSTNGGDGLRMAYRLAREAFIEGGVNRVILATDGDFNVGTVDQSDLVKLIEQEKRSGVFLSVLGVGTDNLKDSTMELLADRGNGHYAYLDTLAEAKRVLIREGDSTFETVAKDVKFQVEFNPATVAAWKLIGYEDRALAAKDFNDDKKDAGEMGAGHTVTVLYEIVPAGTAMDGDDTDGRPAVDPLKYQKAPAPPPRPAVTNGSSELLTVKVRYQPPDGTTSRLIEQAVSPGGPSRYLPFASAVAEFGLLLRDDGAPASRWNDLRSRARSVATYTGRDTDRETFQELVELAAGLRRRRN